MQAIYIREMLNEAFRNADIAQLKDIINVINEVLVEHSDVLNGVEKEALQVKLELMGQRMQALKEKEELMSTAQFSKRVGRSISTLKIWDSEGFLTPLFVDPKTNNRWYAEAQAKAVEIVVGPQVRGNRGKKTKEEVEGIVIKELMTRTEFSKVIGKSCPTLINWEREGKLIPVKIDAKTGYRYYGKEQILEAQKLFNTKGRKPRPNTL